MLLSSTCQLFGSSKQLSIIAQLFKQHSKLNNTVVAPTSFMTQQQRHSGSQADTNRKLHNRVAIVTGSTEGIGFAVAKRMAEDGAKVVVSSRKKEKVDKAVEELKSMFPNQIVGSVCHVGKEEDRDRLLNFTLEQFGAIDILVSNVAVNPYFGSFMDMEESQWDKIFDVNVKAPFMLTKQVVPHMLKNDRPEKGAIVYISSIAAYSGMSSIGAYSISKTALLGLCKNMSMELGPEGIRVNLVAPGVIKTKFSELLWDTEDGENEYYRSATHLKRLGESKELGGIVSFLCGPDASYITGENIVVAGGYHCGL